MTSVARLEPAGHVTGNVARGIFTLASLEHIYCHLSSALGFAMLNLAGDGVYGQAATEMISYISEKQIDGRYCRSWTRASAWGCCVRLGGRPGSGGSLRKRVGLVSVIYSQGGLSEPDAGAAGFKASLVSQ